MKRIVTFSLILPLVIATAALAQAGRRPAGAPMAGPGPERGKVLAEFLKLSDAQKEAWKAAHEEFRSKVQPLHEQKRALRERLRTALEGTDAAAIGKIMLDIRGIDDQLEAARTALDAKLMSALNADQKVRFEAFRAAMKVLRRRPGGAGPAPGPGR